MGTPGRGVGGTQQSVIVYTAGPPTPHLAILHNIGFQFLLGITVVPREIQDSDYHGKIWGETRCTMVYVKMVITGDASPSRLTP